MKMLTAKQVAERLNMSLSLVYTLLNSDELDSYRINSAYRVSEEQVREFLESKRKVRPKVAKPTLRLF